jgi:hypothetical protein
MALVHRAGVEFTGLAVAAALLQLGDADASVGKPAVEPRGVAARHSGLGEGTLFIARRLVHVWAPRTMFLVQRERHFYNA